MSLSINRSKRLLRGTFTYNMISVFPASYLFGNAITSVPPGVFDKLTALEELYVGKKGEIGTIS